MTSNFPNIKERVARAAIAKALQRNSPSSIPLSGWERLQGRDYFSVHLGNQDDEHAFLASDVSENGVDGHWWNGVERRGWPASVPNKSLPKMVLSIKHYYREIELDYRGATRFLVGQLCGWHWIRLRHSRLQGWLYKRKRLVRDEQYQLLRNIYDQTLRNPAYSTSAVDYMTERHGPGWVGHPSNQEMRTYYGLVLEGLAASDDLRVDGARYSLHPNALSTLAKYEEENRRHLDAVHHKKSLVRLTFALVLVGLLQALVVFSNS